jgi:ankyrin repeat protein
MPAMPPPRRNPARDYGKTTPNIKGFCRKPGLGSVGCWVYARIVRRVEGFAMNGPNAERKKATNDKKLLREFMQAALYDRAKAKAMLAAHPELKDFRRMGENALHWLAVEGHAEAVDFLATMGFDVNAVSNLGNQPLVEVASLGNEQVVAALLAHGADPNGASETFGTPLSCALQNGNPRIVKMLLDAGAKLDYVTDMGEVWTDHLPRREEKRREILDLLALYGARP